MNFDTDKLHRNLTNCPVCFKKIEFSHYYERYTFYCKSYIGSPDPFGYYDDWNLHFRFALDTEENSWESSFEAMKFSFKNPKDKALIHSAFKNYEFLSGMELAKEISSKISKIISLR